MATSRQAPGDCDPNKFNYPNAQYAANVLVPIAPAHEM